MSKFSCPVVRVSSVEAHPNADRLSVCTVDDGVARHQVADEAVEVEGLGDALGQFQHGRLFVRGPGGVQ